MFSPVSLSPPSYSLIDHIPCDTSWHQFHRYTKHLYVLIPALVIKEQHLLIVYPAISVYALEMRGLATGVDLQMVKVVDCERRRARRARYLEELEHFAAEVGGVCSRSSADQNVLGFELETVSNLRSTL